MKKIMALGALVLMFPSAALSFTYSNKTYLNLRPELARMPQHTPLWHRHVSNDIGNSYGVTLQASDFYRQLDNTSDIGTYFGATRNRVITIQSVQTLANPDTPPDPEMRQLIFPAESIIHNPTTQSTLSTKMTIRPKHEAYGVTFGLFKDLDSVLEGLSFKIIAPLVHVTNEIQTCFEGGTSDEQTSVLQYFSGRFSQTDTDRIQAKLCCGKFGCSQSTTQFADVQARLAYHFVEGNDHFCGLTLGLSVPTSNEPTGEYLFEPVIGSGNRFGIVAGFDGATLLWKGKSASFELMGRLLYTHYLDATQRRLLSLTAVDGNPLVWGHYHLGGEVGVAGTFPLANVLCRDVCIDATGQLETMMAFMAHFGGFSLTLGGDLYARQGECLKVKNFPENTYGRVNINYDTTSNFADAQNIILAGERLINCDMLDVQAAATPAQTSATIFGTLGYSAESLKYPLLIGVGGSYEFDFNNSIIEGFSIWGMLGLSF